MATIQSLISASSSQPAIFIPGASRPVSFAELNSQISIFRSFLASLNLPPQSAIAIALPNTLEFVIAFLAATYSGFIAAPLNPALKQTEFEFYLTDLAAPVVFIPANGGDTRAVIRATETVGKQASGQAGVKIFTAVFDKSGLAFHGLDGNRVPVKNVKTTVSSKDDVALVLHTSGTTGRPKVVPLTHENLTTSMKNIVSTYNFTAKDRGLLVMPLFHVHGLLAGFLAPLSVGAAVIVPSRFSAHTFWKDFVQYKANWYTAVPTIHQILLKNPPPNPKPEIRFIRSCSSALAPSTFHQLEKTFNAPVIEAYAMTEASHQMTSNDLPPGQRKPGSVGHGQGVEIRILDADGNEVPQGREGEISIRGKNVTKGYRNNKAANESSFTKDNFFRTGDQGKLDKDGYVYITGRIKELINRGGEKISPVELDAVLLEHPAVSEAVSFAVPDELYGQEVHAAVVLKQDAKATEADIKNFLAERVAKFKVPKKVYFTDIMPKTATGKIQRKNVSEKFFGTGEKLKAKL
ncbi:hypothetical protein V1514DRAFT_327437 [Lipomyces japonicus]|uniref:uncharacterized protein n=1 Tax=Lipomyces japonicus TaxID=56871 RepID=UPI0034CED213